MIALGCYAFAPATSIKANTKVAIEAQPIYTLDTTLVLQDTILCPNGHTNCDGSCLGNNTTKENTQNLNCANGHINCDGTCVITGTGVHHGDQSHKGSCGNIPQHDGTGKQHGRGHN